MMKMSKGRKNAIIGFCIFLVLMGICTIAAKGIYRAGLSQVTAQSPYSSSLVHEIKAHGSVRQGMEYGIFAEKGLRVAAVAVRNGEYFDIDEPLFQIDLVDLGSIIEEREFEIKKLKSVQAENQQVQKDKEQEQSKSLHRAMEDYDSVIMEADAQIYKCQQALEAARQELTLYNQYLSNMSYALSTVSGGDAGEVYTQQYDWQVKRNQLEQNVISCSLAVEEAERQKLLQLQSASRVIEDIAETDIDAGSSEDIDNLELAYLEKQLAELKTLVETDGWVYSKSAGRVLECRITVGERIEDEACILYAIDDGIRIIEAVFEEGSGSYLTLEAEVAMKTNLRDGGPFNDKVIVKYIENLGNGNTLVEMSVENLELDIGQSVELSYHTQTENYITCVSSICVHSDELGGNYVYVVEERAGILGTEWRVRKVYVNILDQTDTVVAIKSAEITTDTKIVSTYTEELVDGDVVRYLGG